MSVSTPAIQGGTFVATLAKPYAVGSGGMGRRI